MTTQLPPVRVPVSACPRCQKRCDSATPLGRTAVVPKPGDISLCGGCGLPLKFVQDLHLAEASEEDLASLPVSFLILISRAQDRIAQRLGARRN
jgi:hypothetical protein